MSDASAASTQPITLDNVSATQTATASCLLGGDWHDWEIVGVDKVLRADPKRPVRYGIRRECRSCRGRQSTEYFGADEWQAKLDADAGLRRFVIARELS